MAIDPEEATILYNAACTYALLGETDRAIDLLEKAIRNGYGHKEWIDNDPDFASLRDHPRFQALMQSFSAAELTVTGRQLFGFHSGRYHPIDFLPPGVVDPELEKKGR